MPCASRPNQTTRPCAPAERAEARARRRGLEARLLCPGPLTLDDVACLELLCGLGETEALGLLQTFGSLPEVLGAAAADLARTAGARAAGRVKLAQELSRRQLERPLRVRNVLSSSAAVDAYLRATLVGAPREQFRVLFLDKRNRLIAVHLVVRSLGDRGERLSPKKADLETWRQAFAQALRDRGVEAEATPRRARGVTRKPERTALRKIRERHEAGYGPQATVRRAAYQAAAKAAFGGAAGATAWEDRLAARQRQVRGLYLAQAGLLRRSSEPRDRELGGQVEAFVRGMPMPDTQRLALARELRAANRALERDSGVSKGRSR